MNYKVADDVRAIVLTQGAAAIIDADLYDKINALAPWCFNDTGYAVRRDGERLQYMHRLVAGCADPRMHVIHLNGNRLDNRRHNLRVGTAKEQAQHARPRSSTTGRLKSSPFKGVWKTPSGKWASQIYLDGKKVRLGTFESESEAALAYNIAAVHLFGEFAFQNEV